MKKNGRISISVPAVSIHSMDSVYVPNPLNGVLEPLSYEMIYIIDIYEAKNIRGASLAKKFKNVKRIKIPTFEGAKQKINQLSDKLLKEKNKNKFLMWSQGETEADSSYKAMVKCGQVISEVVYISPKAFSIINTMNRVATTKVKEQVKEVPPEKEDIQAPPPILDKKGLLKRLNGGGK